MTNIFESAKFGDKFRTRDGREAIYKEKDVDLSGSYVWIEGKEGIYYIGTDGSYNAELGSDNDIIGKWEEPISEEQLDRLAEQHCKEMEQLGCEFNSQERLIVMDSFKAGYRKALENKNESIRPLSELRL